MLLVLSSYPSLLPHSFPVIFALSAKHCGNMQILYIEIHRASRQSRKPKSNLTLINTTERRDCESQNATQLSHFAQVFSQADITQDVEAFEFKGSGTEQDPYIVDWTEQDPINLMLYSKAKRCAITGIVAIATPAVALVSSAYSGCAKEVIAEFGCSQEVCEMYYKLFDVR